MKPSRIFASTFLLTTALGAPLPSAAAEPPRPNVLVILTDDQGYADLGAHGNPVLKTPHLDRLHGESVRLENFHVAPVCTPTRAQLLTGMDALRTRAYNVSSGRALLRADVPTAADIFAANGYRTALFGKWHLGDNYPFRPEDRGFQETLSFGSSTLTSVATAWNNDYFDPTLRHNGTGKKFPGYCTDVFFDQAMAWMRERHAQAQPFFLYLPTNTPHVPLRVPDRYRAPYRGLGLPGNLATFFGMIANIDENMGKLEAFLRETGLRDNTIVIFMSDNGSAQGYGYYNAGMRGGKKTLFEGGHRVPAFIRWPAGGLGTGAVPELTQVQDLLPTLVELAGLQDTRGAKFDGVSLAPRLRGRETSLADRSVVIQFTAQGNALARKGRRAAVAWRQWRLIEDKELYDLTSDPAQKTDVASLHPDMVARMRTTYEKWWAGVEPVIARTEAVVIGSEHENPTQLTAADWLDVFLDQSADVRSAEKRNGAWQVDVARAGRYEISLSRWPADADLAMTAASPVLRGPDGGYAAGVALPVAAARLRIGDVDERREVAPEAKTAPFTVTLQPGRTELKTWLLDGQGQELCGAYYVYVRRL